ncbi:MAG: UbiA family prenyltransferase [Saprospiraceae bacterium]|nr:UbiA family prenyltransferase [Saprospiraceae bacterium]
MVITQYLLQYLLLVPIFERNLITPDLDVLHFSLLVLSTVIIAAGGYIINDILDYPIDQINKPDKVIINQQIPITTAYWCYGTLTLIGFIISLYLAIYVKNLPLLLLYPSAVVLLFLYSKFFKQRVIIGNVIVALFCAFVAGIVWFAERYTFADLMRQNALDGSHLQFLLSLYLIFAFLSTMYREIIKDIEDREGDRVYFCKTLPILYGVTISKWVAFICGMGLLFFLFISAVQLIEKQSYIALLFVLLAIVAPLLYSFFKLQQAQSDQAFHQLSTIAKFIMLTGLILLFLI